ncbi:MAG: glycosyltransferase family 4 protein [Prevotella sp.]|nr:glycosyltransferase family 4 protein [Bacteroides sp.]MCM1366254.1 glycosyltransferase family 4 protein [Prevotella sp.]MCM1436341.1 glycosyltransferase family 4 protein [Prevotella sp.]
MKIGYDGKRAIHNLTGLGNYSRLILESVGSRFPDSELKVFTPSLRESPRLTILKSLPNVEIITPAPPAKFKGALWRTFGILPQIKAAGLDIFHGLSNELPFNIQRAGIPSVVTIHDVIYRRLPGCYKIPDLILYDIKYGESCRNATRIIAVSQRTKDDIAELYEINPDKIDVVYQGCDETFKTPLSPIHLEEIRRKYRLPLRYLLQVGTVEKRKNLELSIRALSALPDDIHLVAVGRGKEYLYKMKKLADTLGIASRVHFRSNIPFADLPAINQRAEIILYPSKYEGFGIPVIEALESRRPVVAATGSCLKEAGGDAAWYVNPDNPSELAQLLNKLLQNIDSLEARIEAGKLYARRFDNTLMAANVINVYKHAIEDYKKQVKN